MSLADIAVVTVNYRTPELVAACLASLLTEREIVPALRVVVVDGGSGDHSAAELTNLIKSKEYRDWVRFLPLPINGGFGWANNHAIRNLISQSHPPDFIHLLNPDAIVQRGAVRSLAEYLVRHPEVGAVGSQLLDLDGSWAGSAFSFPTVRGEIARGAATGPIDRLLRVRPVAIRTPEAREVEWATGASLMLRRQTLERVGLFDEGFFLYHEEIELMWRMRRAGWIIATEPRSRVRHVGGASTGVHSREVKERLRPRRPRYWYRSRARFFGLTRGRLVTFAAFTGWIFGHAILQMRRTLGLAKGSKPVDHEFRDSLVHGFPRREDFIPAPKAAHATPSHAPTWMERRWL